MAPDFTVSVKQAEMKRERGRERDGWTGGCAFKIGPARCSQNIMENPF
jgi:hypothetical protein